MKTLICTCSDEATLLFESRYYEACSRVTGITDTFTEVQAFEFDQKRALYYRADKPDTYYQKCHNFSEQNVCNSMITVDPEDLAAQLGALCFACSVNKTIANLSIPEHLPLWCKMEAAKRRALKSEGGYG